MHLAFHTAIVACCSRRAVVFAAVLSCFLHCVDTSQAQSRRRQGTISPSQSPSQSPGVPPAASPTATPSKTSISKAVTRHKQEVKVKPVQATEPIPAPVESNSQSLEQLIAIAESSNPRLAEAVAEIDKSIGYHQQAGLYPNPIAQSGAMQLGGSESQYFAQLSQEIVTRQKLRISSAQTGQAIRQAELRFLVVRYSLLASIRKGYAAVVAAEMRITALQKLVDLARKSAQTAEQLVDAGEGARTDSLLMEIELEKAEVALENAQVAALGARRQLAAIMGVREMQLGELTGTLVTSFDKLAEEIAVDGYIPQNADIMIAEIEVERTRIAARRAEVEPFPNVTVNSGYMHQSQGMENMAILNFSVPVPIWNRNQGNIRAARADIGRAANAAEQWQNEVAREMADAIARFRAARQQVARFEDRIIPKSEKSVQIIQTGFETGEFDFQRLLQAQRSYVEAELGYIESLEAQWNAAAELARIAQVEAFP